MSEQAARDPAAQPETAAQDRAATARSTPSLQQQNDRLQLLLNLTNSVTSSLELKDVLHAIAANFREVMRCDAAGIALPGAEPETFRLYAADFPGGKGFFRDERIITPGENSPAKRAMETLKPVIANPDEGPPEGYGPPGHGHKLALAEGIRAVCFIPLVNRGRALGNLVLARTTADAFTEDDVEFLGQAAGQIAIAIENALAYQSRMHWQARAGTPLPWHQIAGLLWPHRRPPFPRQPPRRLSGAQELAAVLQRRRQPPRRPLRRFRRSAVW